MTAGSAASDKDTQPADGATFICAPATRILTPQSAALVTLLDCLSQRRGLVLSQDPQIPVRVAAGNAPQRLICETSGTSGAAKQICRRPASWMASFELHAGRFGIGPQDVYASFGTLSHSLTLFALLEALHTGADIAQLETLKPTAQCAALRELRVSVLYATPTQLRLMLRGAGGLLPDVRLIFCGGGELDAALRAELRARFPNADLRVFYGASETSFVTLSDADTPPGSVGRAYPGVSIRIGTTGAAPMQSGEIWVQSPYLFDGYQSGADIRRDGGFVTVGDVGYLDADGYLFLRGRSDRMVTVADQNVFPEEIEAVLMQDPAVVVCAALALADPMRGHSITCVIEGDADAPDLPRLRRLIAERLGPQAVPRRMLFWPELPRLPSGKADLIAVRQMLERGP